MVEKVINIVANTDEAKKDVDELNEKIQQTDESTEKLNQTTQKTGKSFKGLRTGIRAVGTALKAAGIGLIIALFVKLGQLLSQNQKIVDLFTTASNALSLVFQDLFAALTNFNETLSNVGNTIKNIILDRIKLVIRGFGLLGDAFLKLIKGDFKEATDLAKAGLASLVDVGDTTRDLIQNAKEYTKAIKEQASAFTELSNQAELAIAQLRRVFEQSDRDAEIQRRIRDDFNKSFKERLEASARLKEILDEQEETQLRLAGLEVQRARQAIRINGNTIENQKALIEALTEQDAIEADIAGRRAEQEAQDRALSQEIIQARKEETQDLIDVNALRVQNKKDSLNEEIKATVEAKQKELEFEKQIAEEKLLIEEYLQQQKLAVVSQTFGQIAFILGENSKVGKAFASAQALINTYQGITEVFANKTTLPEPFGTINKIASAATILASGLKAVKDINSVKTIGGGQTSQPVSAPAFNVVGASGVNQLAQSLNQDQQPVEAYVVGSNVTTQQALDRNIIETATVSG